jgi:type IV secretion system protein VirB10
MSPPPSGPPNGASPIPPNAPPQPKVAPEALALRAKPRPVTRLSRRALILLGSVSALTVGGLAIWALGVQHGGGTPPQELYSTDRKPIAEGLRTLPGDYGSLPKPALPAGALPLGPPLPGDLGRPFLRAQQEQGAPVGTPTSPAGPTAEEQAAAAERERLRQEAEAAKRGALFVQVRQKSADQPAAEAAVAGPATPPNPFAALPGSAESARPDEAASRNAQDKKSAFLNAATDTKIYTSGRLQTPASPFQLIAGTIISAAMVTGLNSDLPGQAIATVTEPVYDTVTGKSLLIPQGSRLLGTYDAQVSYGQSRVLLVWTRLIRPDGSSIVLDRLPGADTKGFAGLEDETDNHWGKLLAGAALSTLLGVGAELGSQNSGLGGTGQQTVVVATSRSAEESVNEVGQQVTRRNLNVQPTLTVRPGFPVRVLVNKDLVLSPYGTAASAAGAPR